MLWVRLMAANAEGHLRERLLHLVNVAARRVAAVNQYGTQSLQFLMSN
uniref:Uncharacterized protein n=1 Tax=Candidozyma auris TaxID=498019 RepID=A0A0L0P1C3_CANAR